MDPTTNCIECGNLFTYRLSQQTGKYCSKVCAHAFHRKRKYENGTLSFGSIRQYLSSEKSPVKYECVDCGVGKMYNDKKLVLHLDHIDGNRSNNMPSNLRWLCPNCHSQTETYGVKNVKNKVLFKANISKGLRENRQRRLLGYSLIGKTADSESADSRFDT